MKKTLYILALLALIPAAAFAIPSSVDRITDHIEPLIKTDFVRGTYFSATSTTATSTFAGAVGIGTTTSLYRLGVIGPIEGQSNLIIGDQYINPQPSAFGTGIHPWQFATSSNDIAGLRLTNTSAGTLAGTGLILTNGSTTRDVAGLSQSYYGGVFFSGGNFDGTPFGINALRKNSIGISSSDGDVAFSAATTTGSIRFFAGPNGYMAGSEDAILNALGNFGIGSTTASSKLTVQGSSSAPTADLFYIASSSGAILLRVASSGNVSIGTTSSAERLTVAGGNIIIDNTAALRSRNAAGTLFNLLLTSSSDNVNVGAPSGGDISVNSSSVFIVKSAGNVGIAHTTPANKLSVNGALSVGTNFNVTAPTGGLIVQGSAGFGTSTPAATLAVMGTTSLPTNNLLYVASSSGAALFVVGANGILGIGTSTATASTLNVVNATTSTNIVGFLTAAGASAMTLSNGGSLTLPLNGLTWSGSSGTLGNNQVVLTGNAAGTMGNTSTGSSAAMTFQGGANAASSMTLKSTGGVGTTDFVRVTVGNNGGTEAMRVISSGNVGIGTSTPVATLVVAGTSSAPTNNLFTVASSTGARMWGVNSNGNEFRGSMNSGDAIMSSGSATVSTTTASGLVVTPNTRFHLTLQNCSTCGTPYVSATTTASFTIGSTNVLDGSTVYWTTYER